MTLQMVPVRGGKIATYSVGNGPDVIFLHGGPGDTHDYMARMAGPLYESFRCIFFDQRGTGKSSDFSRVPKNFSVDSLLSDLMAIRSQLKLKNPSLVGHSWGAMYALFACIQNPEAWNRAALISMGPLDSETAELTSAHLISALNENEKQIWQNLRSDRNLARDEGNLQLVEKIDQERMRLRVKAWVFDPDLRAKFLREYFRDPQPDRAISKLIWQNAEDWFSWDLLSRVQSKLWICTGRNDSVPVAQTEKIARETPHTSASIVDLCGHIPWLEHEDRFYPELSAFLIE